MTTPTYPTVADAIVAARKAAEPLRVRVGDNLFRVHPDGAVEPLSAAARALSGSRRDRRGGRPPIPSYCARCGKRLPSARKAREHCR